MLSGRTREKALLVLRGDGRPALHVRVSSLVTVLLGALAVICVAGPVYLGFQLHGLYGLTARKLAASDDVTAPTRSPVFQLILPHGFQPASVLELRRRGALLHALRLGLGTRRAAGELYGGRVTRAWRDDAEQGPPMDGTLLWPVREGYYVRGFGAGEGGYHLAVDVQAARGTPVLAAAPGVVGYAGNTLRGYGNAIMIVHPGGYVTLYAHNERNEVVPGERVKRGQRIAALGNTGISRGPHLHFELIHDGKNCDPLPLFRPAVRHHENHLGPIAQVAWPPGDARPSSVRCSVRKPHPHSRWEEHSGSEPLAAQ